MSRQEDFKQASQSLEIQVISNPWTLFEKGCEHGYQYARKMIGEILLCIELSNFFPTLDENEEIAKGRKKLIDFVNNTLEEL